jgi:hypothetical protein
MKMPRKNVLFILLILSAVWLFSSAKADWGPDVRLTFNDSVSNICENYAQCVGVESFGRIFVVWHDNRDGNYEIYFKRSTNWGNTWGPDVRLSYHPSFSRLPTLAVDGSGGIHVAWQDRRVSSHNEIYYIRSTDRGETWGSDTLLSDPQRQSWSPAFVAEDSGQLHLIWWDEKPDSSHIYYRRSLDYGMTWNPSIILGDSLAGKASIAADGCGRIHVISEGLLYYVWSNDHGTTWSREVHLSSASVPALRPCVAATKNGHVHVVWNDQRSGPYLDIFYKRSSDRGITWGPDTRMTFTDTLDEYGPVVVEDDSGVVHLLYQKSALGIFYCRSLNGGINWEQPVFLVPGFSTAFPHVTVDIQRNVHVFWRDGRDGNWEIYYKKWDSFSGVENTNTSLCYKNIGMQICSPITRKVLIKYFLSRNDNINLSLYDDLGRKRKNLDMGIRNSGSHEVLLNLNLPSGVYFICLVSAQGVATQKVVVLK